MIQVVIGAMMPGAKVSMTKNDWQHRRLADG